MIIRWFSTGLLLAAFPLAHGRHDSLSLFAGRIDLQDALSQNLSLAETEVLPGPIIVKNDGPMPVHGNDDVRTVLDQFLDVLRRKKHIGIRSDFLSPIRVRIARALNEAEKLPLETLRHRCRANPLVDCRQIPCYETGQRAVSCIIH